MYYAGTVVLGMTEEEFWRCTPRKLKALMDIHCETNSPDKDNKTKLGEGTKPQRTFKGQQVSYIDQLW